MDNSEEECSLKFHEMGLDDRILEALAKLTWQYPTLIQEKAIPLFLKGKDILSRARTGSGKTGAYLVPIIHKILELKLHATKQYISTLILAPSKELCQQVVGHIGELTTFCKKEVTYLDLSPQVPSDAQSSLLAYHPDIVVGTPSKVLEHLRKSSNNIVESLKFLVIDEADLMFAYDHQKELTQILKSIPSLRQSFVTSATMPDDVRTLKNLVLNNPVILKLEEPPLPAGDQLTQYVIKIEELEKVILLYALIRMNLLRGKTIIFVNTVNKCYKVKMFLGHFGIRACVLNSELPVASRGNIVHEFNSNKFNILITSDEKMEAEEQKMSFKEKRRRKKKDQESGVARGIDFQLVSNVVNLDFPSDAVSYVHRVGRTARGDHGGTALSLVSPREMRLFARVESDLNRLMLGSKSSIEDPASKSVFKDYKFNMAAIDGFRYRANDAWKQCTSVAVRDLRRRELKAEILASQKLKPFFEDNPTELEIIRSGISEPKGLPTKRHLRNVPDYNIPSALKRLAASEKKRKKLSSSSAKVSSYSDNRRKSKKRINSKTQYLKRMEDPLRSLQSSKK